MDSTRQYWFGLQAAVIVAVLSAALAGAFQDVPFDIGLLRATLLTAAGLSGLSLARSWLDPGPLASPGQSRVNRKSRIAVAGLILVISGAALLMTIQTRELEPAAKPPTVVPVRDTVHELAGHLADKTWAMEGENCTTQGLRITVDGDDLVVSPRGDAARRYQLFGARGQQLILRSGNSPVFLELRNDGFTLIEGENTEWFGLCS